MNMHYGRYYLIIKILAFKWLKLNFKLRTPNSLNKVGLFVVYKERNTHTNYLFFFFLVPECFVLVGPSCCCSAKITTGTLRAVRRVAALWIPRAATQRNLEAKSAWLLQKKLLYQSQCHPHSQPATRSAWTECHRLALWCQWTATEWALEKQTHSSPSIRSRIPLGDSGLLLLSPYMSAEQSRGQLFQGS